MSDIPVREGIRTSTPAPTAPAGGWGQSGSIYPIGGDIIGLPPWAQTGLDLLNAIQHGAGASGTAADQQKQQTADQNALGIIKGILANYGLDSDSLVQWAYGLITQGYDAAYILAELPNRPEYKARFPANELRKAKGLPVLDAGTYVSMERGYDQVLHNAGIGGFYNRTDLYTKWITGDVSASEAGDRAKAAYAAALGEPADVRAELQRLFGGAAGGVATAYFLDPNNALPQIQRRLIAGEIGGAAVRSGYGPLLSAEEATRLAAEGVTGDRALQGFSQLANDRQLFAPLPGQENAEQTITQAQQLGATFEGNAAAQQAIDRQARQRVAEFAGGGGFASGRQGPQGLGVAS